jgi:hypothetical protein
MQMFMFMLFNKLLKSFAYLGRDRRVSQAITQSGIQLLSSSKTTMLPLVPLRLTMVEGAQHSHSSLYGDHTESEKFLAKVSYLKAAHHHSNDERRQYSRQTQSYIGSHIS